MGKHSSDKEKKAKKAKKKSKREKHKEKKIDQTKEKIPDANSTTSAPEATPQVQVAVTVPLATNLGGDNDAHDKAGTAASGWSWGEAFSAAAEIRPNDDDLDEDFLRRTATAASVGDGNGDDFNQHGGNSGLAAIASMIGNTSSSHPEISEPAMPESTSLGVNTEPTTPTVEESETETALESKKDKKKKKKPKKKDKKKKRTKDSADDTSSDDGSNSKHKSKKRRRSSEEEDDPDPTSDSDGAAALEGRMVPSDPENPSSELIMVLVDAASGIVYSGMDRTESGDLIQVGKLVKGQVVLDPKSISRSEGDEDDVASTFPFPVDADDHCESPLDAYEDLAPILTRLCEGQHGFPKKKSPSDLAIYDPYYCDGSVIRNLSSLGFTNVYNKKEDCYKVWSSDKYPEYDVFVTNPPYSADHIERLMKHVTSSKLSSRPWFLLMPNWVHKKDYYTKALDDAGIKPFYLIPKKGRRYVYIPPKEFRSKKASDVHKKSSPFMSMWYCYGGSPQQNASLVDWCHRYNGGTWDVARSKSALRDLRRKQQKQKGKGKAK